MKRILLLSTFSICAITNAQMTMTSSAMLGSCDCYQLTQNMANDKGAIWSPVQINLNDPFDMTFDIYAGIQDMWGADGMAFVLQQNPTGIGDIGNALGYGDVAPLSVPLISTNRLGIEVDIWNSSPTVASDINEDHLGISSNGSMEHNLGGPYPIPNIEDGLYHEFRVVWSPSLQIITVFIDGSFIFAYNGDIITTIFAGNPMVYFGWTGSTGGVYNETRVCMYRNAAFTADATTVCSDIAINFSDNSTSDLNNIIDYSWDFGDGSPLEANQNPVHTYTAAGTYTAELTMTDVSGCTDVATVNITVLPDLVLNTLATDVDCFGNGNGSATVTPTSGSAPYTYLWDDGLAQTTATATGLVPNTYNVIVTDNMGCDATASVTISEPTELDILMHGGTLACYQDSTADITAVPSGGIAPYTYVWDDYLSQTTQNIFSLPAGTYTVIVTDANGCTITDSYTIVQPNEIFINSITGYDDGTSNGSIDITVSGGTAPYTDFDWSNGATTEDISALASGPYTVTVTDANGCTKDTTIFVKSSVGLDDIESAFNIFPNPSNGLFNIEANGIFNLAVIDAAGKIVFVGVVNNNTSFNLSNELAKGTYTIQLTQGDLVYHKLFVIQ